MSEDKKDLIPVEAQPAKAVPVGIGVRDEVNRIRNLLAAKGRGELASALHNHTDSFAMLHKMDSLAAVSFLCTIEELLTIAVEPMPAAMEAAVNEDGSSAGELDPQQLYAFAQYKKLKLDAIKTLADIIIKRLPTQKQYDPHMWIGGKRFPIPIDETAWTTIDGEAHFKPTVYLYKRFLENAKNEYNAKLEEMATFQGRCFGTKSGQCVYSAKIAKVDKFNPQKGVGDSGDEDGSDDSQVNLPSFPADK